MLTLVTIYEEESYPLRKQESKIAQAPEISLCLKLGSFIRAYTPIVTSHLRSCSNANSKGHRTHMDAWTSSEEQDLPLMGTDAHGLPT